MIGLLKNNILKFTIPLCFLDKENIIVARFNKIYKYNLETKRETFITKLPLSFFRQIFSRFRLTNRLLRLGVRYAIPINEEIVLLVFDYKFFELNLNSKELTETFTIPQGNKPLNISNVNSINGFDDGLYFGEYFENLARDIVNIFRRNINGNWDIVYTFPKDTIEHIHNIIPDPYNNCLWILVGDFDKAAGIWKASYNFEKVEPIIIGKQDYRSCVAFPTESGLVYATDSQLERNSIRILKETNGKWESHLIQEINGSAIYGCMVKNKMFLSTTVEGDSLKKGKIGKFFDREPGPGILNNESHILSGDLESGFNVVLKNKKDSWPFILFQFGTVIFPSGINDSDKLVVYNIALTKNDLNTVIYNIKY